MTLRARNNTHRQARQAHSATALTDNWNMALNDGVGIVTVTQANGAQVSFYPPVSGSCQAPYVGPGTSGTFCALPDVTASLTYNSGSSTYTFVTHPYERHTLPNSSAEG